MTGWCGMLNDCLSSNVGAGDYIQLQNSETEEWLAVTNKKSSAAKRWRKLRTFILANKLFKLLGRNVAYDSPSGATSATATGQESTACHVTLVKKCDVSASTFWQVINTPIHSPATVFPRYYRSPRTYAP